VIKKAREQQQQKPTAQPKPELTPEERAAAKDRGRAKMAAAKSIFNKGASANV
jgi:hypothetical protein